MAKLPKTREAGDGDRAHALCNPSALGLGPKK